jgi:hypothetical protein
MLAYTEWESYCRSLGAGGMARGNLGAYLKRKRGTYKSNLVSSFNLVTNASVC